MQFHQFNYSLICSSIKYCVSVKYKTEINESVKVKLVIHFQNLYQIYSTIYCCHQCVRIEMHSISKSTTYYYYWMYYILLYSISEKSLKTGTPLNKNIFAESLIGILKYSSACIYIWELSSDEVEKSWNHVLSSPREKEKGLISEAKGTVQSFHPFQRYI